MSLIKAMGIEIRQKPNLDRILKEASVIQPTTGNV